MIEVAIPPLVINYSYTAESSVGCDLPGAGSVKSVCTFAWAILILLAAGICGCANTQINAARRDMTNGNYA
jgi:hypothetical protein